MRGFHSNKFCAEVRADYYNRSAGESSGNENEYRKVGHVER